MVTTGVLVPSYVFAGVSGTGRVTSKKKKKKKNPLPFAGHVHAAAAAAERLGGRRARLISDRRPGGGEEIVRLGRDGTEGGDGARKFRLLANALGDDGPDLTAARIFQHESSLKYCNKYAPDGAR